MKVIPNCISASRIILSLLLLFVKPLGAAFYAIYLICGLTDMIDGFIARKTGTTSKLGAKLDSLGDIAMIMVLLFVLYPVLSPPAEILVWVILIAVVRAASMGVGLKKYKTFASIHTYANKFTGGVLFILPLLVPYIDLIVLMYMACAIATISAIEELIIQITSKQLKLDQKSIFAK